MEGMSALCKYREGKLVI